MHALLRATGRRGRALSARAGVGHSGHLSADSLKNQHDAPDLGMAMSHKHKYLFDLNGFLVLRNVFSAEDVAAANAAVDAHVDTYHERTGQLRTSGLYGRESHALAGDGTRGRQDGAAAQAQFDCPMGLAVLADGRVLVAEQGNNRVRMLSADLQVVSTVAGDGTGGHRDGAAMQAAFARSRNFAVLPDGRVLVLTGGSGVRILSADLEQVHTVPHEQGMNAFGLAQLPDGRVLVGSYNASITMLEGFPPALMGPKPAAKPPKKKRGLAGGASASSSSGGASSSSGPALKRGRSGAGPSNAAAADSRSSSSEDEGAGAEAEPLV